MIELCVRRDDREGRRWGGWWVTGFEPVVSLCKVLIINASMVIVPICPVRMPLSACCDGGE
jgi:hypothetical protein